MEVPRGSFCCPLKETETPLGERRRTFPPTAAWLTPIEASSCPSSHCCSVSLLEDAQLAPAGGSLGVERRPSHKVFLSVGGQRTLSWEGVALAHRLNTGHWTCRSGGMRRLRRVSSRLTSFRACRRWSLNPGGSAIDRPMLLNEERFSAVRWLGPDAPHVQLLVGLYYCAAFVE
ncbi:hypothetical protein MRX96_037446 [Rhipicephalus microplus]